MPGAGAYNRPTNVLNIISSRPPPHSEFVGSRSGSPSLARSTMSVGGPPGSSTGSSNSGPSFFGEFIFGATGHIVI